MFGDSGSGSRVLGLVIDELADSAEDMAFVIPLALRVVGHQHI